MSRLYKGTVALSSIGFLFSLAGVLTKGVHPEVFAWLFLYMPLLWVAWICCVFFPWKEKNLRKLLGLWLFVDISVLLLFVSFALGVANWAHAKGIEIVVFTAYFPVVIPIAFLFNLVPEPMGRSISGSVDWLLSSFGGGAGDAFALWMCMSAVAAVQSLILIGLASFIKKRLSRPAKN